MPDFPNRVTKKTCFTPMSQTTFVEDMDSGNLIEGFTYADLDAIETLGVPMNEVASLQRLKERYGYDYPYQFLFNPITQYYSKRARGEHGKAS